MSSVPSKMLIVAPYLDEAEFLVAIEGQLNVKIELLNYKTNITVSRSVWRRHLIILLMSFKAFRKASEQDFILFGEQFVGLYYALFCRLFFWVKRPARSMVLQLIYNRKHGLKGLLYAVVYRWFIQTSSLNYLICHSSLEREYYLSEFGVRVANKIYFVPFGRNKPDEAVFEATTEFDNRYFFAGGTSNRDYKTLIEAFNGISARLIIACHPNDISGINLPENVSAVHNAFGLTFQSYINGARAVILPILSNNVSAGQLVLIDAMRAGKASIVTSGSCMEDYVDQTCALSVPRQDIEALKLAVKQLDENELLCIQLGKSARARYAQEFTRRAFAERLCKVILRDNESDNNRVSVVS